MVLIAHTRCRYTARAMFHPHSCQCGAVLVPLVLARSSSNAVWLHACRKRLQKMISTMRERMEAKLGNSNNNAFRMRKLFKMYDKDGSGRVHFEDFRNMAETFGMQLDDDSLMALYFVYDPEVRGWGVWEGRGEFEGVVITSPN